MPVESVFRTVSVPVRPGVSLSFPSKDPADVLQYTLDAARWLLDAGAALEGCEVFADPSLAVSGQTVEGDAGVLSRIVVSIGGGRDGSLPSLSYLLRLTGGERLAVSVRIPVQARTPPGLLPILPGGSGESGALPTAVSQATATPMIAGADIGGHRPLMFDTFGHVVHAEPMLPGYEFAGMSAQAASDGALVLVVEDGRQVELGWAWRPSARLFVAPGGLLTDVRPTAGVLQQVAVAVSSTTILVRPFPPVVLL